MEVGCDDAVRGRRFEGRQRQREEEGEGVKAKTGELERLGI